MRGSKKSRKRTIEAGGKLRTPKAKLKRVRRDTTKHTKAEQMLQGQKDLYRAIKENDYFGVTLIDSNYKIVLVNKRISGYFHKPASELIGRECFREFKKRDSICPNCPGTRAMATGQPAEAETRKVRDDGSHFSVCIQALPTFGPDENVMGFSEIVQDITERKQAEEKLKQYQLIVKSAHDAIFFKDLESRYVIANDRVFEAFGLPPQKVIGKNDYEVLANEAEAKKNIEDDKIVFKTGKPVEITKLMTCADGKQRWFQAIKVPQFDDEGRIIGLVGIARDITERKNTEDALRESEEKYRGLVENSPNLVAIYQEGALKYVNQIMCEKLGWAFQEMTSPSFNPVEKIIPQRVQSLVKENIAKRLRGENIPPYEISIKTRDGSEIPVIINAQAILYQGKPADEVIFTDITEHKRAEQVIRKEKDRAQKYLDVAAVMLVAIDVEQRVGLINKKGCQILGYSEDEILGKNWFNNFLPERIRDEVREVFNKVLAGQTDGPEYYENPILTKTGEERLIGWHNTILRDDKGKVIATLSSGEDITERKKTEEKLLDDQKQLKTLASQLTLAEERERHRISTELHDQITQLLVISKIKLEGLRKSGMEKDIGSVLDDVCRTLGKTISQTRTLTFDLSSPILYELGFEDAVVEWLTEELQRKHGIKTEFGNDGQDKPLDDDIRILLFRNVRELLFNVVKHSQAKKVKVSISKAGDYIQIIVEDDGVGFEPAEVTMKAAQKGRFGLFSIRQRLEQLGGYFKIDTKPGCGCRVTMTAPLKRDVVRKPGDGPPPGLAMGDAKAGQKA